MGQGPRTRATTRVAIALVAACLIAACGQQATGGSVKSASLVLDFTPNAIHSGIYTAIARHYDRDAGVDLHVIIPGESTDAIKLLATGRADFAILDIHDLAIARQQRQPIVGIMAISERPLASVIAGPAYASPRDLAGQTVGVTGDPSDLAVLRSVVAGAGGDFGRLKKIVIGYNAVADLLSGRVAAATAFWNDEGVTLQHTRPGFHVFRVENYGAPPYPELVLCATAAELKAHPALARGVVHSIVRGYQAVLADPGAGAKALESQVTGLSATDVSEQLSGELPAFRAADGQVEGLDRATLNAWATWEAKFGIVKKRPDVNAMFEFGLA